MEEYNRVETSHDDLPVIGFVGEIYVKYNPFGNHGLVKWMHDKGVEVVVSPMFEFFWQRFINRRIKVDGNICRKDLSWLLYYPSDWYIRRYFKRFERIRSGFRYHRPSHDIETIARMASGSVNLVDQFGEGWLIPGEIIAFYEQGIRNVCACSRSDA